MNIHILFQKVHILKIARKKLLKGLGGHAILRWQHYLEPIF